MIRHFISDLHLWSEQPLLERLFVHYMQNIAPESKELYVLGDLFEVWLGDDAVDEYQQGIIEHFRAYADSGRKLYFMHGNRDFLLGQAFCDAVGGQLLYEPHAINLAGKPALLMHGDALCLDDTDYMKFRAMVRSPEWQAQFLGQTVEQRQAIARGIRDESSARGRDKAPEITDVNQTEVERVILEHDVQLLIHGHTHRQARHALQLKNASCERIVLGDWGPTGSYLTSDDEHLELYNFDLG